MSPLAHGILTGVVAIGAVLILPTLVRNPAGWPGKLSLWLMNRRHSAVTDWGLSHVEIEPQFAILDVGCGGGRTIDKLATLASAGRVSGIDISNQSIAVSRKTNAKWIAAGRVDIQQAAVSKLPFTDAQFDLVTAVETHYYWPDPVADMREILRVLKPGGRLCLIAEVYKGETLDALLQPAMKLLGAKYLTVDQHRELLAAAGFVDIAIDTERRKGWISCVGRKPQD
jgi:SAM-dependent methyltransferase